VFSGGASRLALHPSPGVAVERVRGADVVRAHRAATARARRATFGHAAAANHAQVPDRALPSAAGRSAPVLSSDAAGPTLRRSQSEADGARAPPWRFTPGVTLNRHAVPPRRVRDRSCRFRLLTLLTRPAPQLGEHRRGPGTSTGDRVPCPQKEPHQGSPVQQGSGLRRLNGTGLAVLSRSWRRSGPRDEREASASGCGTSPLSEVLRS